jgi:hypothetical protein
MFEKGAWLYSQGIPHWYPTKFSYLKLSGPGVDHARTIATGNILGRDLRSIDSKGYQVEIIAGVPHPSRQEVAFVESRAKEFPRTNFVHIKFRLILSGPKYPEVSWTIESYNPYFGCNVRFLDWFEDWALFIYREKHRTYICAFGRKYPFYRFWKKHTAVWKKIGDLWTISGDRLGYWDRRGSDFGQLWTIDAGYGILSEDTDKECSEVRVIRLPSLIALRPLSLEAAEKQGLKPESY